MAFNPLANFQKYKKIWMASLILVTMVTFVLCSGFGGSSDEGGFGGWLMRLFQRKGDVIAEINGRSYYANDFRQLKDNREIANKFMRHVLTQSKNALEFLLKQPEELKKHLGGREVAETDHHQVLFAYQEYIEKLKKPRFFEGTGKLEDLVNFKVWLVEADRMGIHLPDSVVSQIILQEALVRVAHPEEKDASLLRLLYPDDFGKISALVQREVSQGTTDDRVVTALRDELRAQLAKMVLRDAPDLTGFDQPSLLHMVLQRPLVPRLTLTPYQWWEYFRKYRSTFDVTLIPVSAEALAKTIPDPTDKELAEFFEAHKNAVDDPTSDKTGLQYPRERFVVEYLMADPEAPHFKTKAEVVHALQLMPPAAWNPLMPPLLTYWQWPNADVLLKAEIDHVLTTKRGRGKQLNDLYGAGQVGDGDYAYYLLSWLGRKNPNAKLAMANLAMAGAGDAFGLFAAVPLFALEAGKGHEELLKTELDRESQAFAKLKSAVDKELPAYATFMALTESPWTALGAGLPLTSVEAPNRILPFSLYRSEEEPKLVRSQAAEYTHSAMLRARELLLKPALQGNPSKLNAALSPIVNDLGLKRVTSKRPYTQFEMERAPELEPLRKAFDKEAATIDMAEGRLEDKRLKGKSFAEALFFGSGEKYGVDGRSHTPRAWPPDVEVQKAPELIKAMLAIQAGDPVAHDERFWDRLQIVDPRYGKQEVPFFHKAENPILFWKHDPPKSEPVRWETEVNAELETELNRIKKDLDRELARTEVDNAKASKTDLEAKLNAVRMRHAQDEKAVRARAAEEIRRTRERTLAAYKLSKAREKLAPELAREIAVEIAKTGCVDKAGDVTRYAADILLAEQKLDTKAINIEKVAPWFQEEIFFGSIKPFAIPRSAGVVLPREDMAKTLLDLPTLSKAIETGNATIDAINKELFEVSKKAFDELPKIARFTQRAPRIVQIIPNRPRTHYYIALLTSSDNPPSSRSVSDMRLDFSRALLSFERRPSPFLEQVYKEAAGEWDREMSEGLRRQHRVEVHADASDAKSFDSDH